jgi:polyisoprenoid-binding protein YceI
MMRFQNAVAAGLLALGLGLQPGLALAKSEKVVVEAPSGDYAMDMAHSSITFSVNYMGLTQYVMRFVKAEAAMAFDGANPDKIKVTASIDPRSIRTGYPTPEKKDWDAELATAENWLNANKFPAITFETTSVKRTGPRTAVVTGTLNMLGASKPIVLNARFNGSQKLLQFSRKPGVGFSATGKFKRSDFNLPTFTPMIGDEVEVRIEAAFLGK